MSEIAAVFNRSCVTIKEKTVAISDESKRVSSRIQIRILYQQYKTSIYVERAQGGEMNAESYHNR